MVRSIWDFVVLHFFKFNMITIVHMYQEIRKIHKASEELQSRFEGP